MKKYEEKKFEESSILFVEAIELNPDCDHFELVYEYLVNCFNTNREIFRNGTLEIHDEIFKVVYLRFE